MQRQQQQHRIGAVKEQVGEMMPARVHPVQFAIEHVREPGQRMPVAGVTGAESPRHSARGPALRHHLVFGDVILIVVIDELVRFEGPINADRDSQENERDPDHPTLARFIFH
jgi:hypothetical protein